MTPQELRRLLCAFAFDYLRALHPGWFARMDELVADGLQPDEVWQQMRDELGIHARAQPYVTCAAQHFLFLESLAAVK